MRALKSLLAALLVAFGLASAQAQSLTLAEVQATGAKPLTAVEVKELVAGAKTEFTLVNGSFRNWTNGADGTFVASRSAGDVNRRSGRGTWAVNDDSAYCLTFDWGGAETESWCRQLWRVEDRYYAFALDAVATTRTGRYRFSR